MIAQQCFNPRKLNTDSWGRFQRIVTAVQILFETIDWDNTAHFKKLETKVYNKMCRIRKDMEQRGELTRSGKDYTHSTKATLTAFEAAVAELQDGDCDVALRITLRRFGVVVMERALRQWKADQQKL